jgi:hypothetical protein
LARQAIRAGLLSALRVIVTHAQQDPKMSPQYLTVLDTTDADPPEFLGDLGNQIWKDPIIQKTFKTLPPNQLPESTTFFLDAIQRIQMKGYRPSDEGLADT